MALLLFRVIQKKKNRNEVNGGVLSMSRINIVETNLVPNGNLTPRTDTVAIIVHHVGELTRDVSAAEIDGWHKNNGWIMIGYEYICRQDGTIERGRPKDALGSHCLGFNDHSVGVCVTGDFNQMDVIPAQIDALVLLLADICDAFNIVPSRTTILGHREKCDTDCPGDNLFAALDSIVDRVKTEMGG